MIIELNHYHNPRVAEFADIVIPGAPPRRNSVPIFHTMDRVGGQCVQINPKKVVAVVDTELPDAGNAADKTNPVSQQPSFYMRLSGNPNQFPSPTRVPRPYSNTSAQAAMVLVEEKQY